jgi:hypothetical protein
VAAASATNGSGETVGAANAPVLVTDRRHRGRQIVRARAGARVRVLALARRASHRRRWARARDLRDRASLVRAVAGVQSVFGCPDPDGCSGGHRRLSRRCRCAWCTRATT